MFRPARLEFWYRIDRTRAKPPKSQFSRSSVSEKRPNWATMAKRFSAAPRRSISTASQSCTQASASIQITVS
ncbi:hypothetical protein ABNQ38_32500 [Azospirillum sp. A29]|uniref:hypothetical protein n=1 Tax=Azospirillum sp. A29 TaxID=3160606 RepID=UPI00366E1E82